VPYYICALPISKRRGPIPEIITDDEEAIAAFVRKWNIPGYGVYRCVGILRDGARRRSLDTIGVIPHIHIDIDARALQESKAEIFKRLRGLPAHPEIRDSGGGYHVILRLREPVLADTPEFEQVNNLRARLTELLGGDRAPDHSAALLRELETSNFKYEGPPTCRVVQSGLPMDISEVEELIDILGDTPLFTPKPKTNGHGHQGDFRVDRSHAGPIDVDERLAAMRYQGSDDSGIHQTQLQCTAALLRAGTPVDDVVAQVVADDVRAAKWDWDIEQHDIETLCYDFVNKNPELAPCLPDKVFAQWNDRLQEGRVRLKICHSCAYGWHVRGRRPLAGEPVAEAPRIEMPGNSPAEPAVRKNSGWHYYYEQTPLVLQEWLVKHLLPKCGVGLIHGQPGSFKTICALDLSLSVMTDQPFAGQYKVKRKGAVLYIACEGGGTPKGRLAVIAKHRDGPDDLPFAFREDCPRLIEPMSKKALAALVAEAAAHVKEVYGADLALVVIDTYATAAGLNSAGDDNDAAVTTRAQEALRHLAKTTGMMVLVVDHQGKNAELGARGSSAKEGSADVVLAVLADKDANGAPTNLRLVVKKQRDGRAHFELPFRAEVIKQGVDEDGDPVTASVLEWDKARHETPKRRKSADVDLLCRVLVEVVKDKASPTTTAGPPCRPPMRRMSGMSSASAARQGRRRPASHGSQSLYTSHRESRRGGLLSRTGGFYGHADRTGSRGGQVDNTLGVVHLSTLDGTKWTGGQGWTCPLVHSIGIRRDNGTQKGTCPDVPS
jgi:AAA domain